VSLSIKTEQNRRFFKKETSLDVGTLFSQCEKFNGRDTRYRPKPKAFSVFK
jgi:hypothetical protein